jgi:7,8-dihydropterin-6-yl-methyl-4-(beta-D-ribofuranosyl)aminobenzene 5'-phosphate synthase
MISEQALAVKVKGKGVILITGCGHQGLGRIIARAKKLFNEPIYAVIGGLHYPVSASRLNIMGVEVQKYFGTGRLPWVPVTLQDVRDAARLLKEEKVGLVAISAHDTSDEALAEFKRLLPDEYRELAVGRRLLID